MQRSTRFSRIWWKSIGIMVLLLFLQKVGWGQYSIISNGASPCISGGSTLEYTLTGTLASNTNCTWTVTNGRIIGSTTGGTSISGTNLTYCYVQWNTGVGSGTLNLTTTSGTYVN